MKKDDLPSFDPERHTANLAALDSAVRAVLGDLLFKACPWVPEHFEKRLFDLQQDLWLVDGTRRAEEARLQRSEDGATR